MGGHSFADALTDNHLDVGFDNGAFEIGGDEFGDLDDAVADSRITATHAKFLRKYDPHKKVGGKSFWGEPWAHGVRVVFPNGQVSNPVSHCWDCWGVSWSEQDMTAREQDRLRTDYGGEFLPDVAVDDLSCKRIYFVFSGTEVNQDVKKKLVATDPFMPLDSAGVEALSQPGGENLLVLSAATYQALEKHPNFKKLHLYAALARNLGNFKKGEYTWKHPNQVIEKCRYIKKKVDTSPCHKSAAAQDWHYFFGVHIDEKGDLVSRGNPFETFDEAYAYVNPIGSFPSAERTKSVARINRIANEFIQNSLNDPHCLLSGWKTSSGPAAEAARKSMIMQVGGSESSASKIPSKKTSSPPKTKKALLPSSKKDTAAKPAKVKVKKDSTNKKRPSPAVSATAFPVGTRKKGGDGKQWVIAANKNGVQRWVRV